MHICFPTHCVLEAVVLIEKHVFNLGLASLQPFPTHPPFTSHSSSAFLPRHLPPLRLSTTLLSFSVTRGLAGDEPMSAEDEERVGGTEEKGRRRGGDWGGVNVKWYRTLTCFGLISAECFVLKPLALIWRLQHLELIIRHTPAALQPAVYMAITSTFSSGNSNFIQLCRDFHRSSPCSRFEQ